MTEQKTEISRIISKAVAETPVVDIHTHLFSPEFGDLLLWGIDELVTYHYLIAETFRWISMSYEDYWRMTKREQADLIWRTLFIEHSPVSEACRGVLTTLERLGLDTSSRDLNSYRRYFAEQSVETFIDKVFTLSNIESVVMTNDPFDDAERPIWVNGKTDDPGFLAALRLDGLLNNWPAACAVMKEWGYDVNESLDEATRLEVRRFLRDWLGRQNAVYMAVSLPPTFRVPEDSPRGVLIEECVLPVAEEVGKPFAMMIGVKKLTNPDLRLAGDSVGKSNIDVVEYLCSHYPSNKFLVTMLARENQHELCIAARKFRNLMVFGCWWFLNNPSTIEEMTRMRVELLGTSMIPQHSDARILDQLVYKWAHSKKIISDVLTDKYTDLAATGWRVHEEEIRRGVDDLFRANFRRFIGGNR